MQHALNRKNILLVDKPHSMSSFDVIRALQRKFPRTKFGHAGTLDPLATGLLILGVGDGTKKLTALTKLPKTYRVEVFLGIRTETGDLEGKILARQPIVAIEQESLQVVLNGFVGIVRLPVPAYSAVKIAGERLYKKARRGEQFSPPLRDMEIRAIRMFNQTKEGDQIVLDIEIDVGSGTYIRSIAEEIGNRLNVPATVKSLRRTRIGDFLVEDAHQLDEITG